MNGADGPMSDKYFTAVFGDDPKLWAGIPALRWYQ
jgi:hypothetical protein